MIKIVKKAGVLLISLVSLSVLAHGQDIPAVTGPTSYDGFHLPDTLGTLTYAISGSGALRAGYYGSGRDIWTTNISGDLAYASSSDVHPFHAVYSGGYLHSSGGQPSTLFQNLSLSQVLTVRRWTFELTDALSYLPDAPVAGLSGIPGVGDLGVDTPGSENGEGILSPYAQRVSNSTAVSAQHPITGSTSFQTSGTYFVQRFVGDTQGFFDSDEEEGTGGLNHRIDALNSVKRTYVFSRFTYPKDGFTFITQGVNVGYQREWTRRLSTTLSAGPQFISSSRTPGTLTTNVAANMGLSYSLERGSTSLSFVRGVQNGSGIVQGTLSNTVSLTSSRTLSRLWHGSVIGSYARNSSVSNLTSNPYSLQSIIGSVQLNRVVAENLSAFVSYSAQTQSSNLGSTVNAFSGLSQTFSVGLTYHPNAVHLGHQ